MAKLKKRTVLIIENDDGMGYNTRVIDEESKIDLGSAISEMDINISADGFNTAKITVIGLHANIKAMLTDVEIICPYCEKNIER